MRQKMDKLVKVDKYDYFKYDFVMIDFDSNQTVCFFNIKYSRLRCKKEILDFVYRCYSFKELQQFLSKYSLVIVSINNYLNKYRTYEVIPKKTYMINKNIERLKNYDKIQ